MGEYGDDVPIPAHARRWCLARMTVKGAVGGAGRKKPLQISLGVQDNLGRWHKVKFRDLYSPSQRTSRYS
jgi:hypothetical protein